jgi:hypothetical protein
VETPYRAPLTRFGSQDRDLMLAAAAPTPEEQFIVAEISLPPGEKQIEANRACNRPPC